jgi:curli biogenesis system outer membrane secretion channel CsgG
MERKNIEQVYDQEHKLINADPKTALQKNKFKIAQYSIMGNVTAFELCAEGVGGEIDVGNLIGLGSFEVGLKKQNARAVINVRIVNATTGEVLHSFVSEGTANSVSGSLNVESLRNLRLNSAAFQNTPLGKAAQEALQNAATEIGKRI